MNRHTYHAEADVPVDTTETDPVTREIEVDNTGQIVAIAPAWPQGTTEVGIALFDQGGAALFPRNADEGYGYVDGMTEAFGVSTPVRDFVEVRFANGDDQDHHAAVFVTVAEVAPADDGPSRPAPAGRSGDRS